ncbi:DUF1841 family protein [Pseudomonadota bacterium]
MFTNDRTKMRKVFTEAWRKHQDKLPMEPLEQVIANILEQHPEYHNLMKDPEAALDKDFTPEGGQSNPFFTYEYAYRYSGATEHQPPGRYCGAVSTDHTADW